MVLDKMGNTSGKSLCIVMKSYTSEITMNVSSDDTFAKIGRQYVIVDHSPPGGFSGYYKGVMIKDTDTPMSLGVQSGDVIKITY